MRQPAGVLRIATFGGSETEDVTILTQDPQDSLIPTHGVKCPPGHYDLLRQHCSSGQDFVILWPYALHPIDAKGGWVRGAKGEEIYQFNPREAFSLGEEDALAQGGVWHGGIRCGWVQENKE